MSSTFGANILINGDELIILYDNGKSKTYKMTKDVLYGENGRRTDFEVKEEIIKRLTKR